MITQWDWSDPREYFHDVIASDKRNPLINPYGPVYGLHENSSDHLTILEPSKNAWHEDTIPTNPAAAMSPRGGGPPTSPYWGNEVIWNTGRQRAQQRDGSEGAGVEHDEHAHAERDARVLQGRLGQSIRESIPDRRRARPSVHGLRSEDQENRDRRHVLQHVPPELRRRCEQHDLERRRRTRRLGEHQGPGRDARSGKGAGLDGAHRRHERQRQA